MEYASFEPLPEDKNRHEQECQRKAEIRSAAIDGIVKYRNLQKLESDYLDRSTFWLDPSSQTILQVQSDGDANPIFYKPDKPIYDHIAKLNGLK